MPALSSSSLAASPTRRLYFFAIMSMLALGGVQGGFAGLANTMRRSSNAVKPSTPPSTLPLHHDPALTNAPELTKLTSASTPSDVSSLSSTDATPEEENDEVTGWRSQLLKASNIASLLCVLDCTALPIVTVVLPFFGFIAATPAQMEFLHWLGHQVALFFVLPVGGSATLLNYWLAHQQKRIAALGGCGLVLVALANAPHSLLSVVHHSRLLSFAYPLVHLVHHGMAHRVTNIMGCACLLGSNYWSKKSGKCLHGHDHSECSDNNNTKSNSNSNDNDTNHSHDHKHDH